jgi:hypothetical protein
LAQYRGGCNAWGDFGCTIEKNTLQPLKLPQTTWLVTTHKLRLLETQPWPLENIGALKLDSGTAGDTHVVGLAPRVETLILHFLIAFFTHQGVVVSTNRGFGSLTGGTHTHNTFRLGYRPAITYRTSLHDESTS